MHCQDQGVHSWLQVQQSPPQQGAVGSSGLAQSRTPEPGAPYGLATGLCWLSSCCHNHVIPSQANQEKSCSGCLVYHILPELHLAWKLEGGSLVCSSLCNAKQPRVSPVTLNALFLIAQPRGNC